MAARPTYLILKYLDFRFDEFTHYHTKALAETDMPIFGELHCLNDSNLFNAIGHARVAWRAALKLPKWQVAEGIQIRGPQS